MDAVEISDLVGLRENQNSFVHLSKSSIGLFIIFLFIVSTYFENNILSNIKGAMEGRYVTTVGVVAQGICVVFLYITLQSLIKKNII